MASVWIPMPLQQHTGGKKIIEVAGENVRQVIDNLDAEFPGIKAQLTADGRLKPSLAVAIDGAVMPTGLFSKVESSSEVHFVPAIGGG